MSYKHILVAVDLSQSSRQVIDRAIAIAKGTDCTMSLVFVDVDRVILEPKEERTLNTELTTLAEQSDYPITNAMVVVGDLHIKLAGIVKEKGIDLVVCGHHHKVFSRMFSPVPKLANAIEADLLVVYLP
ncbi:universal stress protein [Vibrio alfacsensis]|uniref:Universal stress protein n=1 Tax=Vibrio alfacsensis TaxID=1074311 RepID=A0ABN5PJS4_9VIBR|nr:MULTISPECIES: universal stress protein [Vibrio]AXY03395.1 universal stress protein [Vibrio alfacsensis]BBM67218.1 universal stress protein [Vibrio alfacsensis]CAE6917431.1 Universal stress protein family [Vibrio sp. B1REV9]